MVFNDVVAMQSSEPQKALNIESLFCFIPILK